MRVNCSCGKVLKIADNLAGKKVRCPGCKEVIRMPKQEEEALDKLEEEEAPPPKAKKKASHPEPDDDYQDRPPRKKAPPQPSLLKKYGLYLGLAGVAAAAAVVVAIIVFNPFGGGAKGLIAQTKDKDKDHGGDDGEPGTFIDQKKQVGAQLEWSRQIVSRRGGAITFRVVSQGPFSVVLINERGFKAMLKGQKIDKGDVLADITTKEAMVERTVTVPVGMSQFIIENQTNQMVEFHVTCYPAKGQAGEGANAKGAGAPSLAEARRGFKTRLIRKDAGGQPAPKPPPELFHIVHFEAAPGKLAAYLSQPPRDGKRHPAIIWITGGDCNTIGEVWQKAPPKNDQTARAFREAGIIMMYPSLRGGNDNPGSKEGFLGEVDDIVAAGEYLARQDFVDPKQIYLGGHSTGGTLVLLVAASTDRFRAVFSFGPADDVGGYGPEYLPFDTSNPRELELRSPMHWLPAVRIPVFVFEGADEPGNVDSLRAMARACKNPLIQFHLVQGLDHFSILFPATRLVASKILRYDGEKTNLSFTENELSKLPAR